MKLLPKIFTWMILLATCACDPGIKIVQKPILFENIKAKELKRAPSGNQL
jgi:hypothetical protein